MNTIPHDILLIVVTNLTRVSDVQNFALVCKQFHGLISSDPNLNELRERNPIVRKYFEQNLPHEDRDLVFAQEHERYKKWSITIKELESLSSGKMLSTSKVRTTLPLLSYYCNRCAISSNFYLKEFPTNYVARFGHYS